MKKIVALLSVFALSSLFALEVKEAPKPKKVKAQTTLGLYVTAKNAGDYLMKDKNSILIDVRTPAELMFLGSADRMDFHVPLLTVNDSGYWDKLKAYKMHKNKYAIKEIIYELNKREVKKDTAIFITCRSGSTRSAPVVNALAKKGYTNVWTIVDGFQGSKAKEGILKGERVVNGWLHSGYSWTYKLPKDKIWYKCKYKDLFSNEDKKECLN